MKNFVLALVVIAAACASTSPQSPAARDIDAFVNQTLRDVPVVPSLAIAVVRDGRVVYLREPDTAYYIGSTTKAYTGLACAILAQRGQLDLDAPITKYLPEVTLANAPTLRAFLTHTSAIRNGGIVFRTAFSGEHTAPQLVALLNASKAAPPGFQYDNLGYVVASLVMERVTGKPWQDTLDELVFTPLGMRHTSARMSTAARWPMKTGYSFGRNGELAPVTLVKSDRTMHAAGGIVTTAADLARWLEANVSNGRIDGKQVIPAAAFEEAHRLQVPTESVRRGEFKSRGYGLGWYQGTYDGEDILFHGGGYTGWLSLFSVMPKRGVAVGVMTNTSSPLAQAVAGTLAAAIYDRLLDKPNVRLAELKEQVARGKTMLLADAEKRAQRPWTLKHGHDAYVGRFENPMYGTVAIEQRGDKLYASLAHLQSVLEPFPEPDSARVELVPEEGEVLFFHTAADGTVDSFRWHDDVFRRVTP
jgi:CubicO group peptidase (beta-lactamase class C family)